MVALATAIDVGSPATDRASFMEVATHTYIVTENPANLSGRITSVEIWAYSEMTEVKVAIFEEVDTNTFTARDSQIIGTVSAGSKQTFPVDLDIQAGFYIGFYAVIGDIETTLSGSIWGRIGDYTECVGTYFVPIADRTISLGGIGISYLWNTKAVRKWNTTIPNKWNGM